MSLWLCKRLKVLFKGFVCGSYVVCVRFCTWFVRGFVRCRVRSFGCGFERRLYVACLAMCACSSACFQLVGALWTSASIGPASSVRLPYVFRTSSVCFPYRHF